MIHTPLANLSDEEFSSHLATKENPTDEDVEAMERIDRLIEERDGLLERLGARTRKVSPQHVNA